MKMVVNYIDNELTLEEGKVLSIEIANSKFLYRLINDLYSISNGDLIEDITFYENDREINLANKIKIILNYFDFGFDERKTINDLNKYIIDNLDQSSKEKMTTIYLKLLNSFVTSVKMLDLPISINPEEEINNILKLIKYKLTSSNSLFENLCLLIEIEKIIKNNKILFFINSKLYLTDSELQELYKYAIYNGVTLVLIDIKTKKERQLNEKRIIIDENLDEFVIK